MKGMFDAASGTFSMAATFSKGVYIPELLYLSFQATFAAITCCLIVGAFAERMKFSAVLAFMVLWFTFSYCPIAHMVWFWPGPDEFKTAATSAATMSRAGLAFQWGALDFAGGTVVHINSAVAGLVGAYMVGKRLGYGREAFTPHSVTLTMVGASLLWGGLVRLQCRLGSGSRQHRSTRIHQYVLGPRPLRPSHGRSARRS